MPLRTITTRRRSSRARLFSALLALPLFAAAGCEELAELTGAGETAEASVDGSYTLVQVNGKPLPFDLIVADAQNKLVLTRGVWTISGTRLQTEMYTTSIIRGVATREARFNPERHSGTIKVSNGIATATLENGRTIQATISGGRLVQDDKGNKMLFQK